VNPGSGEGRPEMSFMAEDLWLYLKHIFFSNVFARTYVAKAHNAGLFRFDINSVSNSYLDWCSSGLKHAYCVMNARVLSNIGRIKVICLVVF